MGSRRLRLARLSPVVAAPALVCALATAPGLSRADTIHADPKLGYVPIEELSYETIVRPGKGFETELDLRVALHNSSVNSQDGVLALVLPRGSELLGVAINEGGDWVEADAGEVHFDGEEPEEGRRDPGTFWIRPLERGSTADLPAVEIVAYGMGSRATVQVELRLRVRPTLRGDRWQLDLPRRHAKAPSLVDQRRVIVQGLPKGDDFWIDDAPSGGSPYMVTRSEDAITVSWPARLKNQAQLDGSYELRPDPDGKGGRLRMVLRLGPSKPVKPDHVVLIVDRSKSGSSSLPKDSGRVFAQLLDSLPPGTTFDALTFARTAEGLLDPQRVESGKAPRADDEQARTELARSLAATVPGQGTDLRAAMELVGERLAERGAKRPLVLVVTDGMLPPSVDAAAVDQALRGELGKAARPELLFVVDDPLLNARGLPANHPIASLAAGLGARISLETVAKLGPSETAELLAAPRVLGKLSLSLPDSVVLDDVLPEGLVAGDFVVLEGSYEGRAPSRVTVRGRLGKARVKTSFRARKRPAEPEVLVAALREADRERAVGEGFVLPDWYTPSMRRETQLNLEQAGRVGWQATGQLDNAIIHRQLRTRVLPRARACYNKALARNQVLSGAVRLEMEVGKGEVMMAGVGETELNYDAPKLLRCLESAAWSMDVPAGNLDATVYRISYPLSFTAPEGGVAPKTGERDPMFERLLESADALADYQNHAAGDE